VVKFRSQMFHPNSEPLMQPHAPASRGHAAAAPGGRGWRWRCVLLPAVGAASDRSSPHPPPPQTSTPTPPVYADGGICLDILQNQWSPIYDVSAILTSIQVGLGGFGRVGGDGGGRGAGAAAAASPVRGLSRTAVRDRPLSVGVPAIRHLVALALQRRG
jgi:hypothetical protein